MLITNLSRDTLLDDSMKVLHNVQLNKRLRERDKRWRCERWYEKKLMSGQAEIFFIDTNPFILDYHSQPWANNTGT